MRKQSENRGAKISAHNVLLKQFSKEEWKLKQDQLIEKVEMISTYKIYMYLIF